jgi:small subunit ribosomal protein S21
MRNRNKPKGLTVEVRDDNVNVALRKFKKKVDESGRLVDIIERQFYEKPTTERKRKAGAARARWLKKLREQELPKKMY